MESNSLQKQTSVSIQPAKPLQKFTGTREEMRIKALTYLAIARQASVSKETLRLYSAELMEFDDVDVERAILKLARTPREEGMTAFPDLGTLLRAVRSLRRYTVIG